MATGTQLLRTAMYKYQTANRALWNEWTSIHQRSAFYDVKGFKAGKSSLRSIELKEVGPVAGKSLLHLQCHFGLDTLSWARRGANVVGVDFSEEAVALARTLTRESRVEASFICSDIYDLPNILSRKFDIVFTSYGVLCWLPDLKRWGRIISRFLKPQGFFYIIEGHPFANMFDDSPNAKELRFVCPYFHSPDPLEWKVEGSYADRRARVSQPVSYEWSHSLGDVLDALITAGLRLEFLHEFPFASYRKFPFMKQGKDGWWRLRDCAHDLPLLFSLKARKR